MIFITPFLMKPVFFYRGSLICTHTPCHSVVLLSAKTHLFLLQNNYFAGAWYFQACHLDSLYQSNPLTYSASSQRVWQWAHMMMRYFLTCLFAAAMHWLQLMRDSDCLGILVFLIMFSAWAHVQVLPWVSTWQSWSLINSPILQYWHNNLLWY